MLACLSSYFQILEFLEIKFADLNRYTFSSMFSNEKVYLCKSAHFISEKDIRLHPKHCSFNSLN